MPFNARLWQLDSYQSQQLIHISARQKKELISLKNINLIPLFIHFLWAYYAAMFGRVISANESIHINISRCINAPAANNSERDINHE
jgi:hypothetical protein